MMKQLFNPKLVQQNIPEIKKFNIEYTNNCQPLTERLSAGSIPFNNKIKDRILKDISKRNPGRISNNDLALTYREQSIIPAKTFDSP